MTNGISAFLLFPTFKSSKPLTPTYCSRQGNRRIRRNKRRYVEHHARRSEKRKVINCKRLVSKSSTSDATSTVEQERVRRVSARERGPPAFEINDVVTIVKDTSPGVHNAIHIRIHMVTIIRMHTKCVFTLSFFTLDHTYISSLTSYSFSHIRLHLHVHLRPETYTISSLIHAS